MKNKIEQICKHDYRCLISGPVIVLHKCIHCGNEIIDTIDRGPNRFEFDKDGTLYIYDGYTNG